MKRRQLLGLALGYGVGLARAQGSRSSRGSSAPSPFAAGRLVGRVPFVGEGQPPLDRTLGSGLGGRRYLDLSDLDEAALETPREKFFIRTRVPDQLDPARPWTIRVHGLVKSPLVLTPERLASMAAPAGTHLLECSGNDRNSRFGMMSAARWTGVPLAQIVKAAGQRPGATQVLVSGFDRYSRAYPGSEPGAGWVFPLDAALASKAFLATGMNGAPLDADHGSPARLVVPGWYGCAWVKWVDEIALVGDDAPTTDQMREYAGRTHQRGIPERARDYEPAVVDAAALPVRVEQWRVGGKALYRVVGILWGGSSPVRTLLIRLGDRGEPEPVARHAPPSSATWTLWSHAWRPKEPGEYAIELRVADPGIRTRRLAGGHYLRRVRIDEV